MNTAGDVNGDGFSDVIIGAPWYDDGSADGAVFVFLGTATGLAGAPLATQRHAAWFATADQSPSAGFGNAAASAGDVDGDALADIIVGAPSWHGGVTTNQGGAFVFLGGPSAPPGAHPRQLRGDGTTPVSHMGLTGSPDSFRVRVAGRSPFGRGLVRLQWEVKPFGDLLDGTGLQTSPSWVDSGTAGVELEELATGLSEGTAHHWRARLLNHPGTAPFQPAGRWISAPRNGWQEADLRTVATTGGIGDRVWLDMDAGGTQEPWEEGLAGVTVELLDGSPPGHVLAATVTDPNGRYAFPGLSLGSSFALKVTLPADTSLAPVDQGGDDILDSDFDPATLETPSFVLQDAVDSIRWDAGIVPLCAPPSLPVDLTTAGLTPGLETVLTFQDPNPANQVTGYHVYRTSDPSLPYGSWTRLAFEINDEDAGTPGVQWTDATGDAPPGGVWWYQAKAYNSLCPAEGPF